MWRAQDCSSDIPDGKDIVGGENTGYTIVGLEEYISYSITLTAFIASEQVESEPVTVRTNHAGKNNHTYKDAH